MFRSVLVVLAGLLGGVAVLVPSSASGDMPLVSRGVADERVGTLLGWDQTWAMAVGYGRGLRKLVGPYDAELDVTLTAPILALPAFKLESSFEVLFANSVGWGASIVAATGVVLADDPTGTKLSWIGRAAVRPGWYGEAGALGLDLGVRSSLATYMWHSDLVRDLFRDRYAEGMHGGFSGPENGWYRRSALALRGGLVGGYRLGRASLLGMGGFEYSPQVEGVVMNPAIGGMPFYLRAGGDYRW